MIPDLPCTLAVVLALLRGVAHPDLPELPDLPDLNFIDSQGLPDLEMLQCVGEMPTMNELPELQSADVVFAQSASAPQVPLERICSQMVHAIEASNSFAEGLTS